jgi:protein-L-isoaspartate(D-aspartate) O-methyltransferase
MGLPASDCLPGQGRQLDVSTLLEGKSMSSFTAARQHMVDGQVRTSDVTDMRILAAMLALPRETFVPESQRPLAYLDLDIALADAPGRYLVKPVVIARLLQALELRDTDKVLVVGCASGYTAALAARLAAEVVATESDPALAARANANLAELGLTNVRVEQAAAADGFPAAAPYDAIVFDGATEVEPEGLYRQLADGGRLAGVFVTSEPSRGVLVTRSQDEFGRRVLFNIGAPVLPGLQRRPEFVF